VPALAKFLTNNELAAPAIAAMQSIGRASAPALRDALKASTGRTQIGIVLALGSLKDEKAADLIRPLNQPAEGQLLLAAAWAAAQLADSDAVPALMNLPPGQGFDRIKLNSACVLLAENLAKAGKTEDAKMLYRHLRETRLQPTEAHVRDAAKRGMEGL